MPDQTEGVKGRNEEREQTSQEFPRKRFRTFRTIPFTDPETRCTVYRDKSMIEETRSLFKSLSLIFGTKPQSSPREAVQTDDDSLVG